MDTVKGKELEPGIHGHQLQGDPHGVESAASDGDDCSAVTSHHADGDRTAGADGADPAVSGESSNHDADSPAGPGQLGRDRDSHSQTDEEAPRRRRVGSGASRATCVKMDLVSAPAMAARCMFGNMTTNARTQGYIIEEGKVKVTWEMDEFFKYLSDEDITDDYEAGINGNVKRAARKLLGDYSGLSEESSPSCEV